MAEQLNQLTDEERREGYELLFNGTDLTGWFRVEDGFGGWHVEDDSICLTPPGGMLYTTEEFDNFILKAEYRLEKEVNSGIFLRTSPNPDDIKSRCYELNIADTADNDFPTGSFVQRQRVEGDHDSTDWQTFEITANGPHFLVKLDGQMVLDYTDPEPLERDTSACSSIPERSSSATLNSSRWEWRASSMAAT